jgi:hypothetical protein
MWRLKLGGGMTGIYVQRQTHSTMAAGKPLLDERKTTLNWPQWREK